MENKHPAILPFVEMSLIVFSWIKLQKKKKKITMGGTTFKENSWSHF